MAIKKWRTTTRKIGSKRIKVKVLRGSGRIRRIGVKNTTDKNAPKRSRRVKGWVNNKDTRGKKGIARKNHRRNRNFINVGLY